jgi:hypothetical protein
MIRGRLPILAPPAFLAGLRRAGCARPRYHVGVGSGLTLVFVFRETKQGLWQRLHIIPGVNCIVQGRMIVEMIDRQSFQPVGSLAFELSGDGLEIAEQAVLQAL